MFHTKAATFANLFHCITGPIGISLNAILIAAVMKRTPSALKAYSFLILNFAISDFLVCLMESMMQTR